MTRKMIRPPSAATKSAAMPTARPSSPGMALLTGGAVLLALAALAPAARALDSSAGVMQVDPMAEGLQGPWAFDFLPDGSVLVTEIAGNLLHVSGGETRAIAGLPPIRSGGQGGLLDIMVPKDFQTSRELWFTYNDMADGGLATAVGRGLLSEDLTRITDFTTVWTGTGAPGGRHFGSRLVEAQDGTIFVTTGDRGTGPDGHEAQDPGLSHGKVIHLARDGSPVSINAAWAPGVHSLGHRNAQGAALRPDGGLLVVEHGARGGDEVNLVTAGKNYGWPVISYGRNYNGARLGEGTEKEGMEQPLHYWDPSIAPSGLMVYSGALVADWQGDIFTGSLNSDFLSRLDPDTQAETGWAEERLQSPETTRVRDVMEGPDGAIWFLSEGNGALYRLRPEG